MRCFETTLYLKKALSSSFSLSSLDQTSVHHQRDGAAQPCCVALEGRPQPRLLGEGVLFEFGFDDRSEHIPGGGDIPNDDDLARRQRGGDHAQPAAQERRHLLERLDGVDIVSLCHLYQRGEALWRWRSAELLVVTKAGAIRADGLPAAAAAAAAERAVGLHLDVSKLSGHAVRAAKQLPIGKDSGSNSLRDVDDDEVVQAVAVAEPHLGEGAGVGHVVHLDVQAGGALNAGLDARYRPVEIRGEDKFFEPGVGAAGKTDADAIERFVAMGRHQLANCRDDALDRLIRIGRQRDDILSDDLAAKIGDDNCRLRGMNIERDYGSLVIQFEKSRSASAGRSSRRAFKDPLLLDQIFDDQRNGAALQTGDAGKIGTR